MSKTGKIRGFLLFRELVFLSKEIESNRVNVTVLKGPLLSKRLFGDVTRRQCRDLDLLVSEQDVDEVESVLISNGYNPVDVPALHNKEEYKRFHHHFSFYHPSKQVLVELHWRLTSDPSLKMSYRLRGSELSGLFLLDEVSEFIYLCLHAYGHYWRRTKWLCDVYFYLKKNGDDFLNKVKAHENWQDYQKQVEDTILLADYTFGDVRVLPKRLKRVLDLSLRFNFDEHYDWSLLKKFSFHVKRNLIDLDRRGFAGWLKFLKFRFVDQQLYKEPLLLIKTPLIRDLLAPVFIFKK